MAKILVLFYSESDRTRYLAEEIADGVVSADGEAVVRTLPKVAYTNTKSPVVAVDESVPYAEISDLAECDGLIFGSPTHFGHMAAPMQYYFEQAVDLWLDGTLIDKPFGVFTSSASLHGGHESTLLSMALPCLHMGMIYVGVPYSVKSLTKTKRGGGPYGAGQWSESEAQLHPAKDEVLIANALGVRVTNIAKKNKLSI